MPFEVHIWGPAFGLPSIDPACIAVVAFCNLTVPRGEWHLVSDYDITISTRAQFPLLLDGPRKIVGFTNIVSYLRDHYPSAYGVDHHLTRQQKTDKIAYISFLESTASPLLDLYLYVSSENYNSTTSSAYTQILPWYTNYTIPPKRRDLARSRTAHLGLSGLDVSEATEDTRAPGSGTASSEYESAKRAAGIPTSNQPKALHLGRGKGLGGLLSTPMYAARFKLDTLSNGLFEPLSDLLGEKEYLFSGDKPSSLDCLALGYLALMFYPSVPQAWLKEALETKHVRLSRYTQRMRGELLGKEDIKPADIWSISKGHMKPLDLPWQSKQPQSVMSHVWLAANQILGTVPLFSPLVQRDPIVQDVSRARSRDYPSSLLSPTVKTILTTISATASAGFVGLAIYHRRSPRDGPLVFTSLRPFTQLNGVGVGGAESFLSVFAGQLPR